MYKKSDASDNKPSKEDRDLRWEKEVEKMRHELADRLENTSWEATWTQGVLCPSNGHTGNKYNGNNVLFCMLSSAINHYDSNRWYTINQIDEVRKGQEDMGRHIHIGACVQKVFDLKKKEMAFEYEPDSMKPVRDYKICTEDSVVLPWKEYNRSTKLYQDKLDFNGNPMTKTYLKGDVIPLYNEDGSTPKRTARYPELVECTEDGTMYPMFMRISKSWDEVVPLYEEVNGERKVAMRPGRKGNFYPVLDESGVGFKMREAREGGMHHKIGLSTLRLFRYEKYTDKQRQNILDRWNRNGYQGDNPTLKSKPKGTFTMEDVPESYASTFVVVNRDQVVGMPPLVHTISNWDIKEESKRMAEALGLKGFVESDELGAFYRPSEDKVCLPRAERFLEEMKKNWNGTQEELMKEVEHEYLSTLIHEMAHSVEHESRLNRKEYLNKIIPSDKKFYHNVKRPDGSVQSKEIPRAMVIYSVNECVAELTSMTLCSNYGISSSRMLDNSTDYISHFSSFFRDDEKCIMNPKGNFNTTMFDAIIRMSSESCSYINNKLMEYDKTHEKITTLGNAVQNQESVVQVAKPQEKKPELAKPVKVKSDTTLKI